MPGQQIEKARIVEYHPVPGSALSPTDAAVVGPAVERLKQGTKEPPKLSAVVDAARPRGSSLHRFFEWDDGKAAQKFRIEQARWLVRSVRVVVRYVSGATSTRLLTQRIQVTEQPSHEAKVQQPMRHLFARTTVSPEPEAPREASREKAVVAGPSVPVGHLEGDDGPQLKATPENSRMLADGVRDLLAWKRKYVMLSGLPGLKYVFRAIHELENP